MVVKRGECWRDVRIYCHQHDLFGPHLFRAAVCALRSCSCFSIRRTRVASAWSQLDQHITYLHAADLIGLHHHCGCNIREVLYILT